MRNIVKLLGLIGFTEIDSAREINDATGDAAPGTGDEDTKMKSDAGSASDHGEGQDRPESRDTPSDSEEPETSLKSKAHPNLHVTSTSGGLKTEHKNGSIIEHLLKADRPVLEIKDDEKETHVLAEIQSIRPQRRGAPNQGVEYISQFVVERRYPDTKAWCVEAVDQREVSSAVKDWNAIEKNKWIHRPSEEANKSFSKEDLGEMVLHLACFYNVPKLRTAGAARRNPPTRHILITSNQGLMMMSDGNFKRYIGNDEEANKYTAESCKRAKIPAPWETESKEIKGMVDTCHRPLSKTVKAGGIVQMPQHITESSSLFGTKELEARIARVEDRIDKIDKLEMQVNQMMKLLQKALDL